MNVQLRLFKDIMIDFKVREGHVVGCIQKSRSAIWAYTDEAKGNESWISKLRSFVRILLAESCLNKCEG